MENTLVELLKNIVRHPEDIRVEREEIELGVVVFRIFSHEEDKGLIIGKSGRTIKALKDIIAVKALKENKKVLLKID